MRQLYDYICSSEDRKHYDNETNYLYGFRYSMKSPYVINVINKTEVIEQRISDEELNKIIDTRIPQITETVANDIISSIEEIDGNSTSAYTPIGEEGG